MEAKGCAKPAVWKNARRHFYWAVRARIASSAALADIADASPGATYKYRLRLLNSLAGIEPTTEYRVIAEKLEGLDLTQTISQLRADHLARRFIDLTQEDRKAAMTGLMRLADNLSEEERASLISVLQNASRSPGTSSGFSSLMLYSWFRQAPHHM
jgi:acetyl-CoA carboxylase/biotin carboxylase 1